MDVRRGSKYLIQVLDGSVGHLDRHQPCVPLETLEACYRVAGEIYILEEREARYTLLVLLNITSSCESRQPCC
jgi:hypothetical protein